MIRRTLLLQLNRLIHHQYSLIDIIFYLYMNISRNEIDPNCMSSLIERCANETARKIILNGFLKSITLLTINLLNILPHKYVLINIEILIFIERLPIIDRYT